MSGADFFKLFVTIGVSQAVGIMGSLFTFSSLDSWYTGLAKSSLTPPSWVFGPVWTLLYALMGIAAYLVWRRGSLRPGVSLALSLFVFQLLCNGLWSYFFFKLQNPLLAFADIVVLLVSVIGTAFAFKRVSKAAALLLLPYIAWVAFAACLNLSIVFLN